MLHGKQQEILIGQLDKKTKLKLNIGLSKQKQSTNSSSIYHASSIRDLDINLYQLTGLWL